MTIHTLPRPRTLDDVIGAVGALTARIDAVVEGQLQLSQQMGALLGEMAGLRKHVTTIPPPPMQDWREQSRHDWDPELMRLGQVLRQEVKNPERPQFNSDRAKAIVDEAVKAARRDDKAAAYDALRKNGTRIVVGIMVGVAVAMTLAHFGLHP